MGVGALKLIAASLSLGRTSELPKVCSCHSPISETEHDPCQGKCEGPQGPSQMQATEIGGCLLNVMCLFICIVILNY